MSVNGLGERGAALWDALVERFEWDEHESELLLETCRTLDVIDALAVAVERDGVMVTGSQGQPVLNGAVAELRQQQAAYARLMAQLNLDAAELGAVLSARARAARTAGQQRWRAQREARNATA